MFMEAKENKRGPVPSSHRAMGLDIKYFRVGITSPQQARLKPRGGGSYPRSGGKKEKGRRKKNWVTKKKKVTDRRT